VIVREPVQGTHVRRHRFLREPKQVGVGNRWKLLMNSERYFLYLVHNTPKTREGEYGM
jgi:hypothetical protein